MLASSKSTSRMTGGLGGGGGAEVDVSSSPSFQGFSNASMESPNPPVSSAESQSNNNNNTTNNNNQSEGKTFFSAASPSSSSSSSPSSSSSSSSSSSLSDRFRADPRSSPESPGSSLSFSNPAFQINPPPQSRQLTTTTSTSTTSAMLSFSHQQQQQQQPQQYQQHQPIQHQEQATSPFAGRSTHDYGFPSVQSSGYSAIHEEKGYPPTTPPGFAPQPTQQHPQQPQPQHQHQQQPHASEDSYSSQQQEEIPARKLSYSGTPPRFVPSSASVASTQRNLSIGARRALKNGGVAGGGFDAPPHLEGLDQAGGFLVVMRRSDRLFSRFLRGLSFFPLTPIPISLSLSLILPLSINQFLIIFCFLNYSFFFGPHRTLVPRPQDCPIFQYGDLDHHQYGRHYRGVLAGGSTQGFALDSIPTSCRCNPGASLRSLGGPDGCGAGGWNAYNGRSHSHHHHYHH